MLCSKWIALKSGKTILKKKSIFFDSYYLVVTIFKRMFHVLIKYIPSTSCIYEYIEVSLKAYTFYITIVFLLSSVFTHTYEKFHMSEKSSYMTLLNRFSIYLVTGHRCVRTWLWLNFNLPALG